MSNKYIDMIKGMYNRVVLGQENCWYGTFPTTIGLHQELVLNSLSLCLGRNEFTKYIQNKYHSACVCWKYY